MPENSSRPKNKGSSDVSGQSARVSNGDSYQAGRDIRIVKIIRSSLVLQILLGLLALSILAFVIAALTDNPWNPFAPAEARLELQPIYPTVERLLDVRLRNTGEQTAIINRLAVTVLADGGKVKPQLSFSADYTIPLQGAAVGESRELSVAHYVDGGQADRFSINLQAKRSLNIRLTLYYNDGQEVSQEITL